jgi:hypothetical protein
MFLPIRNFSFIDLSLINETAVFLSLKGNPRDVKTPSLIDHNSKSSEYIRFPATALESINSDFPEFFGPTMIIFLFSSE